MCGSVGPVCGSVGPVYGSVGPMCGNVGPECGSFGPVCGSVGSVCGSLSGVSGDVRRQWQLVIGRVVLGCSTAAGTRMLSSPALSPDIPVLCRVVLFYLGGQRRGKT